MLSQYANVAISTMHTLEAHPLTAIPLPGRHSPPARGFVECAATEKSVADLIAHA